MKRSQLFDEIYRNDCLSRIFFQNHEICILEMMPENVLKTKIMQTNWSEVPHFILQQAIDDIVSSA